jgi:hypothetical protein
MFFNIYDFCSYTLNFVPYHFLNLSRKNNQVKNAKELSSTIDKIW